MVLFDTMYVREIGCEYLQFAFDFAEKLCWTSAVREKVQGTKCTFLFYLNWKVSDETQHDQIRKRNSKKDHYIINPRIFNLHPSFITTPVPFHYTTTTPPQISRKVLMDVDFTPIFLALLPLFLTLGTLLGLGLSGTSSSSSTTPSITVSVNNTVGSGTAAGNQFT